MCATEGQGVFAVRLTGCEPIKEGCHANPHKNPSYMAERAQLIK